MNIKMLISLVIFSLLLTSLPAQSDGDRGRDPKRVAGGDRGNCDTIATQDSSVDDLVALVPTKGEMQIASITPSLWFYSPYAAVAPLTAKLTLRDENDKLVMQPVDVTLPKNAGIVSIQVPKPLQQDTSYRWYFSVVCDATHPAKNPRVQGWLRVIKPTSTLNNQLRQASSPAQAATLYRQAGLWNDALTLVAKQRDVSANARSIWSELLKAENLDAIAAKPIRLCCTPR